MSPDAPSLADAARSGARGAEIARAQGVLRDGGLVIFPTETLAGAGVRGDRPESVALLASMLGSAPTAAKVAGPLGATLHLPDATALSRLLADAGVEAAPAHRRIMQRLLPGPVRLLIELDGQGLGRVRAALSLAPGAADIDGALSVRVPRHPVASAVLGSGAVVAVAAAALAHMSDAQLASAWAGRGGFMRLAADGDVARGTRSTTVVLSGNGGVRIASEGAWPAHEVWRALEERILFVCTGNTCRSPMAEAIARHMVGSRPEGPIRTIVESAGTGGGGSGATREAVDAMRRRGLDISRHVSRALTREMIERADVIYTMTARHAGAVEAMSPAARGKTRVLDPEGRDVEDPIGQPESEYERVASTLERLIRRRLDELDTNRGGGARPSNRERGA